MAWILITETYLRLPRLFIIWHEFQGKAVRYSFAYMLTYMFILYTFFTTLSDLIGTPRCQIMIIAAIQNALN